MAAAQLTNISRFGMDPPPPDDTRLREAMLYVAQRLEDDPGGRGAVKLNKILWWADFESFRERQRSVTGAVYQRLPEGPAPVRLVPVREKLLGLGDAQLISRDAGAGLQEHMLLASRDPAQVFDSDDMKHLDAAIAKFRGMSARECSDFSHRASVGWRAVGDQQVIPYETSIIDPRPLTDRDRERGRAMAVAAGLAAG